MVPFCTFPSSQTLCMPTMRLSVTNTRTICWNVTVYRRWRLYCLPASFSQVPIKQKHRKILGLAIRQHRTKAGMSIERLAERADLHPNYVGEIERGEKAASIDTLVKLAKGLRIRPFRLLTKL